MNAMNLPLQQFTSLSHTHTHTDEAVSLPVAAANVSKTTLVERL